MFVDLKKGGNMGKAPSEVIFAWYVQARALPDAGSAANEIYDLFLAVQRLEDLVSAMPYPADPFSGPEYDDGEADE